MILHLVACTADAPFASPDAVEPAASTAAPAPTVPPTAEEPLPELPIADVEVLAVELNPGVPILAWDGEEIDPADRNAGLPAGRDLLVRAYVAADDRELEGRLDVLGTPLVLVDRATPEPDPGDVAGTFDFLVPGDAVGEGTRVRFTVHALDPAAPAGDGSVTVDLGADPRPLVLEVVVVPIAYDRDGCRAAPDLDSGLLDELEDAIYEQNPVSEVRVSIGAELPFGGDLTDAGGVAQAMNAVYTRRRQDDPLPQVYYYGLYDNCGVCVQYGGDTEECFRGLSYAIPRDTVADADERVAVGQQDDRTAWTFVHELGHLQGRSHVACPDFDAGGTDLTYPYPDGHTGGWGYGLASGELHDPATHFDYMTNCVPAWVSDWEWNATGARIATLSSW